MKRTIKAQKANRADRAILAGRAALALCLTLGTCRSKTESGSSSGDEKPPYASFETGEVDEVPWTAGSEAEDYK